jgi:hypothetical protein
MLFQTHFFNLLILIHSLTTILDPFFKISVLIDSLTTILDPFFQALNTDRLSDCYFRPIFAIFQY